MWVIQQRKLWGDYGDILLRGMAIRRSEGAVLDLERNGPFIPPVSFPYPRVEAHGAIVVSDAFRREIEAAGFPDVRFREVRKKLIVRLDWHEWDLQAEKPREYPEDGGPESYVFDQPHDPIAAEQMGPVWEMVGPREELRLFRAEDQHGGFLDHFELHEGGPLVHPIATTGFDLVVNDAGRDWLEARAGEWVRFCRVEE